MNRQNPVPMTQSLTNLKDSLSASDQTSSNPITNTGRDDTTLSGQTTKALREAIITGEISPGEKLNEPKLAEQFQVSRGPLREAIRRLVAMRLVRHVPHIGASVVTLELTDIMELYDVREALEGKAAALAAQNMSTADINKLKDLLQVHRQHCEQHSGEYMQTEGDFDFHYQIIKGSGNQLLTEQLCDELYHLIRMFRFQTSQFKSRSNRALIEHEQLIYAIEQRDPELAEILMRKHIARAKASIKAALTNTDAEN